MHPGVSITQELWLSERVTGRGRQGVWCAGCGAPCKMSFQFAEAEFNLGILEHWEDKLYLITGSTSSPYLCVPSQEIRESKGRGRRPVRGLLSNSGER